MNLMAGVALSQANSRKEGLSAGRWVLLLGLYLIVRGSMAKGLEGVFPSGPDSGLSWPTVVAQVLACVACLVAGRAWSGIPLMGILPLSSFRADIFPAVLSVTLGLSILHSLQINWAAETWPELMPSGEQLFFDPMPMLLLALCVGPLCEEFVYRGVLLGTILPRSSVGKTVVVSAFGFALGHMHPFLFPGMFALGLVFGWLRVSTGSLWPGIWGHLAFNAFPDVPEVLHIRIPGYNGPGPQPVWFNVLGVASLCLGLYLLRRLNARPDGT